VSQELARVTDVVCQPSGADTTGELATAHLILRTKALPARLERSREPSYSYFLRLNSPTISQNASRHLVDLQNLDSGLIGLSDPRLADGIDSLDVVVAQMATSTRTRKVQVWKTLSSFEVAQEVRTYLLLARDGEMNDRWIRIRLLSIAEDGHKRMDRYDFFNSHDKKWPEKNPPESKEAFEEELNEYAGAHQEIFRRFDECLDQDLTIW